MSTLPAGTRVVDGHPLDYTEIARPVIQYELYNPANEPAEFMYNGEIYLVPAHDVRWRGRHPQQGEVIEYPEPGILPLWGKPHLRISALDILRHAVGDDGVSGAVGGRGVRPLFGDDRDALVKKEAREAWVESRVALCIATTRAHENSVRLAGENAMERPIPGRRVMEAYRFLAENQQALSRAFSCGICNWGFPSDAELQVHCVTMHPNTEASVAAREKLGLTGAHHNEPPPSMVPRGRKATDVSQVDLRPTAAPAVAIRATGEGMQNEGRELDEMDPMRSGYKPPDEEPRIERR